MDDEIRLVPAEDSSALTDATTTMPLPVAVEELATTVLAALDMIAAIVPDLRKPHPATAKKVRGARTISREAVMSIVAMVDVTPALQRSGVLDTDRAREVLASSDDYRLVAERIQRLAAQVKYTGEARWAEVAAKAMSVYAFARRLAKDSGDGELAAHVATIRRHLGRRNAATGKRTKEPKPE